MRSRDNNNIISQSEAVPNGIFHYWERWVWGTWLNISLSVCGVFVRSGVGRGPQWLDPPSLLLSWWRPTLGDPPWVTHLGPRRLRPPRVTHHPEPWGDPAGKATHLPPPHRSYRFLAGVR